MSRISISHPLHTAPATVTSQATCCCCCHIHKCSPAHQPPIAAAATAHTHAHTHTHTHTSTHLTCHGVVLQDLKVQKLPDVFHLHARAALKHGGVQAPLHHRLRVAEVLEVCRQGVAARAGVVWASSRSSSR